MMKTGSSVAVAACAAVLAASPLAMAEDHAHGHGDHAGGPASSGLVLNKGKKWQTDEQLRGGMTVIRDELQKALEPIHAGTYSAADYAGLAARIEGQVTHVIGRCKLPPEVDIQFHLVLADILAGTDVMKKDGNRMGGAVKVIKALDAYARFFEHKGWKPIQH